MTTEVITTVLNTRVSSKEMDAFFQRLNAKAKQAGQGFMGFNQVMRMTDDQFASMNTTTRQFQTRAGRAANAVRFMTRGFKGFRMELLGVMFFGMGVMNMFKGLLQPALQLTGIFDIFTILLQTLFLPVALMLLDPLLMLLDWFLSMSDSTKRMIGIVVLAGIVLGGLAMVFGAVALGIGAVIGIGAALFTLIDGLIPDINLLGVNFSSFIETGLGVGLVGTAFGGLTGIIGDLIDKFFELDFVEDFLDTMGIQVDENKEGFDKLKDVVSQVLDKIAEALGFEDGWAQFKLNLKEVTSNFDGAFKSAEDARAKFEEIAEEIDFGELLEDLANIAGFLADIVGWLQKIPTDSILGRGFSGGFEEFGRKIRQGQEALLSGELFSSVGEAVNTNPNFTPAVTQTININGYNQNDIQKLIEQGIRESADRYYSLAQSNSTPR